MPPKVKVNVISEPSDDTVTYDAIVEASNAEQEPQLLDDYVVRQDVSDKKS